MRGEKDAEKVMSPMFPRLHVSDTEKGGPRAPPRNKMALYEQLSIPSQRFTSGSSSTLPHAQNSSGDAVSSISSGQASAYRNMFAPFCNSSIPSYISEKLQHPSSSGGVKLNTTMKDNEKGSARPTNFPRSNATEPLQLAVESDSSQAQNLSNSKNFSFKIYENEDDITESKKLPHLSFSSTLQHKSPCENERSRNLVRNHSEENPKVSERSQDCIGRFSSVAVGGDKDIEDNFSYPLTAADDIKSSNPSHASLNQENYSSMAILNKLHGGNIQPQEEFVASRDKVSHRGNILIEPTSKVRLESECLTQQHVDERSPKWLGNGVECREERNCGTLMNRHDGILKISMVGAISALSVLPDDVVGVIGEKQFWKARRTITYQQRIFAVQVFELHRLMTVQRSFASSPDLMHADHPYLHKPAAKASPVKKTPLENVVEPHASVVNLKSKSETPNPSTERNQENLVMQLALHSVNNNTSKGLIPDQSNYAEHLRNSPSAPSINKSVALPFHPPPPGNQWLVPVMSPSEGLVYKAYTGPCPPSAGYVVPNYGSCGPMSLNPERTYLGPAFNQQGIRVLPGTPLPFGQAYFPPPYGLPVMSSFVPNSAVEQMSPFGIGRANDQEHQSSFEETNFPKPHQSSCNISSQTSRVKSSHGAVQASKRNEFYRSTASTNTPPERRRGDELPLFPVAPTAEEPDENVQFSKHQTRVIKVVPHNPRTATESAARIFQSIQEEKKHLQLVSS